MERILIVDNDDQLLPLIETIITQHGFWVSTATSERTLFQRIDEFNPEIILLDVRLYNEDGREICKKIKDNEKTKHICVILFSSSAHNLNNYHLYKADGILQKPFIMQSFLEVIAKCTTEVQ